jgi:hypothetical protein
MREDGRIKSEESAAIEVDLASAAAVLQATLMEKQQRIIFTTASQVWSGISHLYRNSKCPSLQNK